jgi:hypothetical protein
MSLKKRIENILLNYQIAREESKINMLEKIADDFAIEFAIWCLENGLYNQLKRTQIINEKVLEAFKKEKDNEAIHKTM